MVSDSDSSSRSESVLALNARHRAGELDQTISKLRRSLAKVRWLYIPALFIVLMAMVIGLVLGVGSTGSMIGGLLANAAGIVSLLRKTGISQDEISRLEVERDSYLAVIQSGTEDTKSQITP